MSKSLEYVDEQMVIDLTKRLIKSQSLSGSENKLATLMAIEMTKAGFYEVKYDDNNNIVGKMPGLSSGKSLMLAGYIDTVPAGTMEKPFEPEEIDGSKIGTKGKVITGRGSVDMKSSMAAMISVANAFKRSRARLKGDFIVVGLANTKTGKSTGIKSILKKFELKPDYIVAGAPTNLNIHTAHPGQAIYEILAKGKMSNIGNPEAGENAILKMNRIINCLQENSILPEDKRFGKANMIVSSITSNPVGEAHSVPNLCHSLLVRQYFKNEYPEKIKDEFLTILKQNNFKDDDVQLNLKRHFKPYDVEVDVEPIKILQAANNLVTGKAAKVGQWSGGINISEVFDVDLPVVGFGPGDEKFANTPIEHVSMKQIATAAKIYTVLAEKICVQMKVKR